MKAKNEEKLEKMFLPKPIFHLLVAKQNSKQNEFQILFFGIVLWSVGKVFENFQKQY